MTETEEEAKPAFRVRARPNGNNTGFRRSGHFFKTSEWTNLTADQMTPAIRNEAMLEVEEAVPNGFQTAAISPEISLLQRQLADAGVALVEANAEVDRLTQEIADLKQKTPLVAPPHSEEPALTTQEDVDRFDCPYCEKDYATQDNLNKHLEEKHGFEWSADQTAGAEGAPDPTAGEKG